MANRALSEISEDAYARAQRLVTSAEHPAFGIVTHGGVAPRLSVTPVAAGTSPEFGGDTVDVLRELGYTELELERLRTQGAIPKADALPLV